MQELAFSFEGCRVALRELKFELSAGFLKAPVVAIDVRDDVLENIKHMDLGDAEGWRKLTNKAPATDRPYIGQVQQTLEFMRSDGLRECWVFNVRSV